jgi:ATP-grasp in the biosynthetic pathway with Ter operon
MNILVFPCGSEIGLEICRAFEGVKGVALIGGSSVADHGRFVFQRYREDLPNVDDADFLERFSDIVEQEDVGFVFPTHDSVVLKLAEHQEKLRCQVIGSPAETCRIARSKGSTYRHLRGIVPTPVVYARTDVQFPAFLKPDAGQGSKGTFLAQDQRDIEFYTEKDPSLLILEYLPGEEYTVDCFTDRNGELLFVGPRRRSRILNGISVGTSNVPGDEFAEMARRINGRMVFNGAWFFQVKRSKSGVLTLLEVAPRIGGSSGLHRVLGVNLPVLSYYNQSGIPVTIHCNRFDVEMDRAWSNRYKLGIDYKRVYLDFDDCLCTQGKLNPNIVKFVIQAINQGKKVCLLSRHRDGPLADKLKQLRISDLFDEVHQINADRSKADFVREDSIFIDDSFAERLEVSKKGIPVFSVDAVEALLSN